MASEHTRLRVYLGIFVGVMILGPLGFMAAEGSSFLDAVYFTIVTIATVGYGDIAPLTPAGKVLAMVLIVTGVGTFVGVVGNATEVFLARREKQAAVMKLHIVIGLFFSETGTKLLHYCSQADPSLAELERLLPIAGSWEERDFGKARTLLGGHEFVVDVGRIDCVGFRQFLSEQGKLLIRLLETPYMLEHEAFTDLLIAILHLKEELEQRQGFSDLPPSDWQHLAGDIKRVYGQLTLHWLDYMGHLKRHYPFLFSLAVRTNPFNPAASAIVR